MAPTLYCESNRNRQPFSRSMRRLPVLAACAMVFTALFVGTVTCADLASSDKEVAESDVTRDGFDLRLYCRVAAELLEQPEDHRIDRLRKLSAHCDELGKRMNIIVLCQLLFQRTKRPALGRPFTIIELPVEYEVAEPLVFYRNMPILVVTGYRGSGQFETNLMYLEYCLKSRKWVDDVFDARDAEKCKTVMQEFIDRLGSEITATEREILFKQIRPGALVE